MLMHMPLNTRLPYDGSADEGKVHQHPHHQTFLYPLLVTIILVVHRIRLIDAVDRSTKNYEKLFV